MLCQIFKIKVICFFNIFTEALCVLFLLFIYFRSNTEALCYFESQWHRFLSFMSHCFLLDWEMDKRQKKEKACNSWQYELKGQRSRTSEIRADSERTCCTATVSAECNPNRCWGLSMRTQAASKTPAAFLRHYSVLFLHLDVRKNTLTCSPARLCLPDWAALRRKQ